MRYTLVELRVHLLGEQTFALYSDHAILRTTSKTPNPPSSPTTNSSYTSAKKTPNTRAKTAQTASDGSPKALSTCCAMYVERNLPPTHPIQLQKQNHINSITTYKPP